MHVVVIGNGVAGVTAALRIRKRQRTWKITLISGESTLFYSRPALMYVYMGHLRYEQIVPHPARYFDDQRIERVQDFVLSIDISAQRLALRSGASMAYDALLIATGSKPRKLGWPGQDTAGVRGLYDLADLAYIEQHTAGVRRAVIAGAGLIGVELAEMLLSRRIEVTFLAREDSYWRGALPAEESAMVTETVRSHHVDLRLNTQLAIIEPDSGGRVARVMTDGGEAIDCQFVGLTVGVEPNLSALGDAPIPKARGILVDASLTTRVPNVYACGDCAEIVDGEATTGRIEQLWYTGRMQGEVVGDVIAGHPARYDRGTWFNSAKFFDLEWHTYGRVSPDPARVPMHRYHFWRHPTKRIALRIVTEADAVIGMNAFGLRQRQGVWTRWIEEGRSLADVLRSLGEANFDPELFHSHEPAIRSALTQGAA